MPDPKAFWSVVNHLTGNDHATDFLKDSPLREKRSDVIFLKEVIFELINSWFRNQLKVNKHGFVLNNCSTTSSCDAESRVEIAYF